MPKTFTAVSTLVGTIIGAGILGIPYVIMRSGFGIGLIIMLIVGAITLTTSLYLGEIALRTKENLHLSGYAEKYLGKKAKTIMFFAFAFGIYSALTAYLVGESESLSVLFFQTSSYSLYFGIAFWLALSYITFFGLKALKEGENTGLIITIILMISVIIKFWNKIEVNNLIYNNPQLFFVPFGVVLFAFLGFSVIPEIERILGNEKKAMKKTIVLSYMATFIIYLLFTIVVLGSKGQDTPQIATIALGKIFILIGMLTMLTSYLALTTALVNMLHFDYKKTKTKSWLYTILVPLIVFIILNLTKTVTFTKILGIGGVISGGIVGTMILLMVKKAKKLGKEKPSYSIPYSSILTWIIIAVFALGTLLEIFSVVSS